MKYFLPDWDDRIDPGYDYITDRQTYGRSPYRDDVYAHEFFGDRSPYDGVLVSRSALGETGPKRDLIERIGFRRFLRLPVQMEVMGDCGAFGYIGEPRPRYTTPEILDYYGRLGVDYGISVDHIVVPEFPEQREARYQLTLDNALDFLRLHRAVGARFAPVGAVQGWDVPSYVAAARQLAAEGYRLLAVGGLARLRTMQVRRIIEAVTGAVGPRVGIHVLGIARDQLLLDFARWGVFSIDSASPMRSAWTSANRNYLASRRDYLAIRVPFSSPIQGIRSDNLLSRREGTPAVKELERLERHALVALWGYGHREVGLESVLATIEEYDRHLTRRGTEFREQRQLEAYRRTLTDRPWERCRCRVCATLGIDVVIFRGTNRNRGRGFHNTMFFYRRLRRVVEGQRAGADDLSGLSVPASPARVGGLC